MTYSTEEHRNTYMTFHAKRADYLMRCLAELPVSKSDSVLDVGRSPLTNLVFREFPRLSTLGFAPASTLLDKADPIDAALVPHIVFDLNKCDTPSEWVAPGTFRLVLFNEVMEHLQLSPYWVFRYLRELLVPGGFLVIQTPNAVSLGHRVRMVLGRNPYVEFARQGELGSHHFREYTKQELIAHAVSEDLVPFSHEFVNYFPSASIPLRALSRVTGLVPAFRNGQTFVFRRRE